MIDYDLVPEGATILQSTMIAKRKRFPDGRLRSYKARLCVRGDQQREGIDFFETYAPVVQMSTVRLMLTLAAKHNFVTKQVDYANAFVQAKLDTDVYVHLPSCVCANTEKRQVFKLKKSLYGLRQAPLKWFEKLREGMIERGFKQSKQDPCLFLADNLVAVVWVDDVLFFAREEKKIDEMIKSLSTDFEMKVEGDVTSFLGLTIRKFENGSFEILQTGLIERILQASGMIDCNPAKTPAAKLPLGSDLGGNKHFEGKEKYSSIVGMLLYLAGHSRPDIAFAVHQVARFTHNPTRKHQTALKTILRYLKGTRDKGLMFKPNDDEETSGLHANCDADFAGLYEVESKDYPISVKSRTGFVIRLDNCPVVWKSKLQSLIALSTLESEYIALSQCMRELIPLRRVLSDITNAFGLEDVTAHAHSTVFEDNNGALQLANTGNLTPRTKHIALRYHHFRSEVDSGNIVVKHVESKEQVADIFTKGLTDNFIYLREKLMGW